MDYSTQLLEFIDGTLDSAEELALFNALSSNEELRAELKHLLAISSSVRNDITPFIPPTSSTQHIFSQLGFTPPLPIPGAAAATTAGSGAGAAAGAAAGAGRAGALGMRRLFPALASAAAASLTTAALFLMFGNSSPEAPLPAGALAHTPRTSSLERILAHNTGGAGNRTIQAGEQQYNNRQYQQPVREVVRYVYIPQPETSTPASTAAGRMDAPEQVSAQSITRDEILASPLASVSGTLPANIASRHWSTIEAESSPLTPNPWGESSQSALTVELRDNVSLSIPNATVDPATTSWLTNNVVGVFYDLGDHQSIGVEVGQEAFFQRFEARNAAGRRYQYEQSPVLPWAGLVYRYSFADAGSFNPFGQLFVGGAKVGYLGRTLVGVNYMPSPSLRLTAGVEGSLLYYPVQGSWYQSARLGFTYGIGFTF